MFLSNIVVEAWMKSDDRQPKNGVLTRHAIAGSIRRRDTKAGQDFGAALFPFGDKTHTTSLRSRST